MWVSIAPSLIAILPPHPVAKQKGRVQYGEDAQGSDHGGKDVADTHGLFSFVCINCGDQAQAQFSAA
jgi:hypothetical protein